MEVNIMTVQEEENKRQELMKQAEILKDQETNNTIDVLTESPKDFIVTYKEMYQNVADLGTEEIDQSDLRTPLLKIIQENTREIDNKKVGWFYRSDTKEQIQYPEVTLVYVTTVEELDYKKKNMVKKKVYFGYYKDTNEPFKMYVQGWGMEGHRNFQTEVLQWKKRASVPMLALSIQLSTQSQQGEAAEDGTPYDIFKLVFKVLKDEEENILVQMNPKRISFLVESVSKFRDISTTSSENDDKQNDTGDMPF